MGFWVPRGGMRTHDVERVESCPRANPAQVGRGPGRDEEVRTIPMARHGPDCEGSRPPFRRDPRTSRCAGLIKSSGKAPWHIGISDEVTERARCVVDRPMPDGSRRLPELWQGWPPRAPPTRRRRGLGPRTSGAAQNHPWPPGYYWAGALRRPEFQRTKGATWWSCDDGTPPASARAPSRLMPDTATCLACPPARSVRFRPPSR